MCYSSGSNARGYELSIERSYEELNDATPEVDYTNIATALIILFDFFLSHLTS
jgi:hypothetical protein